MDQGNEETDISTQYRLNKYNNKAILSNQPPICSYGIILYKFENSVKKYLMIRRKHTFGFIVIVRGKYTVHDSHQLQIEVDKLTSYEKECILNNSFDDNWDYLWNGYYPQQYNKEKSYAQYRYNVHIDKIKEFIVSSSTKWLEPEWEFPKGRLHVSEPNLNGAIREFTEETNIPLSEITIIKNLYPFEEIYVSSNNKVYKNTYYLAKFTSKYECNLNRFQIEEVSKMEWMDESECIHHIRPYNTEKKMLIRNINSVIHNYLVI